MLYDGYNSNPVGQGDSHQRTLGFGFCFGCEEKALSLSVDLEAIEVIMVIEVAPLCGSIPNIRRAVGRYFAYFRKVWQQATANRLA